MDKPIKQFYEAPSTTVFEARQEGVLCASQTGATGSPTYNGFNTEEEW